MKTTFTIDLSEGTIYNAIHSQVAKELNKMEIENDIRRIINLKYEHRIKKTFENGSFIQSLAKNIVKADPMLISGILAQLNIAEIEKAVIEKVSEQLTKTLAEKMMK